MSQHGRRFVRADEQSEKKSRTPSSSCPRLSPSYRGDPAFKGRVSDDSEDDEPASTLDTREAAASSNWQRLQNDQAAKRSREAKIATLKKARDTSKRFAKLEGKGLGDVDDAGDLDARSWLKSQSKRQKKIEAERAERTAREQEERERVASINYTSSDLIGVQVAHEIDDFEEAEGEQILTLKDKNIGDEEDDDDELEAREIVDRENLSKKLDLKKKKPVYDVHAENVDGEKKLLAQYDEDTDRKRKFKLDGSGNSVEAREAKKRAVGDLLQSSRATISLKAPESSDVMMSDYVTDIKIKKPKKDKKKKRERIIDEDDIFPTVGNIDSMEVESSSARALPITEDLNGVMQDDEDLQLALGQSRKAAFKKRKRMGPEELARELKAQSQGTLDDDSGNENGLIFDETTNFVENLQVTRPEVETNPLQRRYTTPPADKVSPEDADGDVPMHAAHEPLEAAAKNVIDREARTEADRTATGLDDEATMEQGLGATLNLLRQRGLVEDQGGANLNATQRARELFLKEKHDKESAAEHWARSQRERDRNTGTFDRMSAKDRQDYARYENSRREQQDQRAMAEFFNANYRPNVELKYVDEEGRKLDAKEAFKHLSHQFHGKGSGKLKTEKRLKKVEDEKKREAASVLDSSQATGMNVAAGTTAKKNKQAGVRLM